MSIGVCRRGGSVLSILLVMLVFSAPLSSAQAQDAAATEKQLQRLQKDMRQLQSWVERASKERKGVEQQLRDADREIGAVSEALHRQQRLIGEHRRELAGLADRRARLLEQKQQQAVQLAAQLAAAYQAGRQDRLKLLLNQEHPESLQRLLRYYDYLNEARVSALNEYQQTLAELAALEQGAAAREALLEGELRQLESRQQSLEQAKQRRAQALTALNSDIRDRSQKLKQLKADRQQLAKVLEEIQRSLRANALLRDSKQFVQMKGQLAWPASGRLLSRFGTQGEGQLPQEGIFIQAQAGRAVQAVHHGRVVFADWLRGYGLLLIVDHGGGYMSLYGHNQSLLKATGDWVSANEQIATIGRSGGRSESGLYFALRYNGRAQDPLPWLGRKSG